MDQLRAWNERQGMVSAVEFIFFLAISALLGFAVGIGTVLLFE